jgi:metal-dependent amidase/aminoacylase/carboxypeptidase family protein
MVHPAPIDGLRPRVSAVAHFDVSYTGKESHAAAAPQLGINAADALTIAQVAIGLLRQHLRPTDQVHGIVLEGGAAANIVPAHARGDWMVRARTIAELDEVRPRVEHCFEAGAHATGAQLAITDVCPVYSHMEHDDDLVALYEEATSEERATLAGGHMSEHRPANMPRGRRYTDAEMTFSTDMGNVSLAMPSIHPTIGIESAGAVNHQPEFAAACINRSADEAVLDGAIGLALTAIGAATRPALRERLLSR